MGWMRAKDFVRLCFCPLLLFMMTFMIPSVVSLIPGAASNLSSCHADLSACRGYFRRSALNLLPTCCGQLMRAVQQSDAQCTCHSLTIAANKDQALSVAFDCGLRRDAVDHCYDVSRVAKSGTKFSEWNSIASTDSLQIDGSRMTASPTESLDGKSAMSKRSLSEFCTGCKEGDYNVNSTKPPPT